MTFQQKRGVLIVDDNRTNREQTAHLLQRGGFEVFLAETDAEALRLAKQEDLGVVLIDNISGGLEAAQRIQQIHPYASIVVYSASAGDQRLREKAEQLHVYVSEWIEKSASVTPHLKGMVVKESVKAGLRERMKTASEECASIEDVIDMIPPQVSSLQPMVAQTILRELNTESSLQGQSPLPRSTRTSTMRAIADEIERTYEEMQDLVERQAGQPGLRDELLPLCERLRVLQEREAVEIAKHYDSRLRPNHEQALEFIRRARELFGK
jgi:CheY-like chemotaxis protein